MKSDLICWDSCVLIDWITGGKPSRISSIETVVESINNGYYKLAFSTLLYVEVIGSTMSKGAIKKFDKFMKNKEQIELFAVDMRIAKKAQEIRNGTSLKTPDAVHVATAIVSGAKFFHTFDKQLLSLSEANRVEGLKITACDIPGTFSLFD